MCNVKNPVLRARKALFHTVLLINEEYLEGEIEEYSSLEGLLTPPPKEGFRNEALTSSKAPTT